MTRAELSRLKFQTGGVALATVFGVGMVLRLHDIGVRSLWVAELSSVRLAAGPGVPHRDRDLSGDEGNITLQDAFMCGCVRLVGAAAGTARIRLPSVVFVVMDIRALYRLGSRLDRSAVSVWRALHAIDCAGAGRALISLFWLMAPILTIHVPSYVKSLSRRRYLPAALPAIPLPTAIGLIAS